MRGQVSRVRMLSKRRPRFFVPDALVRQSWCCTPSIASGHLVRSSSSVIPPWNLAKSWLATICPSMLSRRILSSLQRASITRLNFSKSTESRKSNMFSLPSETILAVQYWGGFSALQEMPALKCAPITTGSRGVTAAPAPSSRLRLMKVNLKIGMTKMTAAYERWFSDIEGTSAPDDGDKRRSIFFATTRRKRTTTLRYFRSSAPALTHCSSHSSARKGISHSVFKILCRAFGSASGPIFSMLAINRAAANSSKTKCLAWYIKPSNVNAFAISSATSVILQPFLGPWQRCHARMPEAIALPAPAPRGE